VARFTEEDDALLDELGVEVEAKQQSSRTAHEERIIAGFEEIQRFVKQHSRAPQHGEDREIFERLYAVRLARIIHEKCAIKAKPLISFTTMRMGCLMKFFAMKSLAQLFGGLGRFRAVR